MIINKLQSIIKDLLTIGYTQRNREEFRKQEALASEAFAIQLI